MARRGDLWACVFKGAVLKYCHKANAETERVPRGQSIESGGHGLKAAAEKAGRSAFASGCGERK